MMPHNCLLYKAFFGVVGLGGADCERSVLAGFGIFSQR